MVALVMNIHILPAPTDRGLEEAAAKFHAEEAIRELIRLHGRRKTEFILSAIFEDEASRLHQ